jgi:hypothetical protein
MGEIDVIGNDFAGDNGVVLDRDIALVCHENSRKPRLFVQFYVSSACATHIE